MDDQQAWGFFSCQPGAPLPRHGLDTTRDPTDSTRADISDVGVTRDGALRPSTQPNSERPHMSHLLYRIGNFAGRHPWRVITVWLFIAGAIFLLNSSQGGQYDETFSLPGSESQAASDAIQERFPQETLYASNVILHSDDGLTTPATKAAVTQAVERLSDGPHVVAVGSPYDPRAPTLSADGQTAFLTVSFDTEKVGVVEFDAAEK